MVIYATRVIIMAESLPTRRGKINAKLGDLIISSDFDSGIVTLGWRHCMSATINFINNSKPQGTKFNSTFMSYVLCILCECNTWTLKVIQCQMVNPLLFCQVTLIVLKSARVLMLALGSSTFGPPQTVLELNLKTVTGLGFIFQYQHLLILVPRYLGEMHLCFVMLWCLSSIC